MRVFLMMVLVFLGVTGFGSLAASSDNDPYQIIVHPENPIRSLDRAFLADVYLKKVRFWPDNQVILPVDLPPDSPLRQSFSQGILKRSVSSIRTYWQQRIFTGRGVPPPELDHDVDVLNYVRNHPGAIGYISKRSPPRDVRVISIK